MSAESRHRFLWTRRGAFCAGIVAVTGLALGFLAYLSTSLPETREFSGRIEGAPPIEDPSGSPSAYFRYVLRLGEPVRHAWIQVGATDAFDLYVNGRRVGRGVYRSAWVTGVYDISPYLQVGENVLAVEVDRLSYPGSAQLMARGEVFGSVTREPAGFATGPAWRSSPVPSGSGELTPWTARGFDDEEWSRAARPAAADASPFRPLPVPAEVFRSPPEGRWLRIPAAVAGSARLIREFPLGERPDAGWVHVASTAGCELYVNGQPAGRESETSHGSSTLFPVSRLLRSGANTLTLRPLPTGRDVEIHAELLTRGGSGRISRISTDATWTLRTGRDGFSPQVGSLTPIEGRPVRSPDTLYPIALSDVQARIPGPFFPAAWATLASLLGALLLVAFWAIPARLRHPIGTPAIAGHLQRDALAHLPILLAASVVLLLRYDYRLDPATVTRPAVAAALVFGLLLLKVAFLLRPSTGSRHTLPQHRLGGRWRRHAVLAVLLLVTIAGAAYRMQRLDRVSLDHDELSILSMARGVARAGYPHRPLGSAEKVLTTYELVPYPIAASCMAFGWNEWGARLPGVLFGTGTLFLIGWIGWKHLSWQTGLLAASAYAVLPSAVLWSRNAFHLQQTQFFALLCVWTAHLAIRRKPCPALPVLASAVFFLLTYLSWEGSGFLLPVLLGALVVRRWGDASWLKERALWFAGSVVTAVVLLQQARRVLHQVEYRALGGGLSQVKTPSLFFLDPRWDPLFYVKNFLGVEHQSVLTLAALFSLPLLFRRALSRHLLFVLAGLLFCYTNLLSAYSTRYVHFALPLLVVLAAEGIVELSLGARLLAARVLRREGRILVGFACTGLMALLLLSTNGRLLRLYELSSSPARPKPLTRMNVYRIDYRGAAEFVRQHAADGDLIIPNVPLALEHYAGMAGDYFLNTLASKRVLYDTDAPVPGYMDRFAGYPVIRSAAELRESLHRSERAWILVAPTFGFVSHNDPEVVDLLRSESRVVYESYRAQVFLWDP